MGICVSAPRSIWTTTTTGDGKKAIMLLETYIALVFVGRRTLGGTVDTVCALLCRLDPQDWFQVACPSFIFPANSFQIHWKGKSGKPCQSGMSAD